MHWTKTPEGRKKLSIAQTKRWAKRENGHVDMGTVTLVSVEYQKADGTLQKQYLRRKTDPQVSKEMFARTIHRVEVRP